MNTPAAAPTAAPTVRVTPDFKPGETILHKYEGTEHVIEAIDANGNLQISGRAGLLPPTAAEKKLP